MRGPIIRSDQRAICLDLFLHTLSDQARIGDHIWYVSDVRKFQAHYPEWTYTYDIRSMMKEIIDAAEVRAKAG